MLKWQRLAEAGIARRRHLRLNVRAVRCDGSVLRSMRKEVTMNILEELGYIGSFINAIAMIGSVVYLALQVRQANRLAHLSATDALRDSTNRFREVLLNGDNIEVWLKGIREKDQLTDLERYRWDELALYLMDSTQATYLRALHLGEPFTINRIGYTVRYASAAPGYGLWWQSRRERFHPEFARFVDDNLGKPVEAVNASSRNTREAV